MMIHQEHNRKITCKSRNFACI